MNTAVNRVETGTNKLADGNLKGGLRDLESANYNAKVGVGRVGDATNSAGNVGHNATK